MEKTSRRSSGVGSRTDWKTASPWEMFLHFFNGDWSSRIPIHHCSGCCSSREEAIAHMYSAGIGVDITLSAGKLPSVDDWGSTAADCSMVCLGILCHGVLPAIVEIGLPSWKDLGGDGAEGADADAENLQAFRLKVQKKAHRTRCVLADKDQCLGLLLLSWMGALLEKLMSQLQHLDSTRQGLLDLSVDALNPFLACRKALCALVVGERDGPLSPIYDFLPIEEHVRLDGLVRGMGQDFSSQVKWRFRAMEHEPYTFGSWIHPSVTRAGRLEKVKAFHRKNKCCLEQDFALRAQVVHDTPEALASDRGFRKILETWRMGFVFTNMVMERLLAMWRRNTEGEHDDLERIFANGKLVPWLSEHTRRGLPDPRAQSRTELLKAGVPLVICSVVFFFLNLLDG